MTEMKEKKKGTEQGEKIDLAVIPGTEVVRELERKLESEFEAKKPATISEIEEMIAKQEELQAEEDARLDEKQLLDEERKQRWAALKQKRKKARLKKAGVWGGVVLSLVMVVVVANLVASRFRIDYRGSYIVAKELRKTIQQMRNDYGCENVIDYVENSYITKNNYDEQIEKCLEQGRKTREGTDKLSSTEGVIRDGRLGESYAEYEESLKKIVLEGKDVKEKLEIRKMWHRWILAEKEVDDWGETETKLKEAVRVLVEGKNKVLKKYGEEWLKKRVEIAKAYRDFYESSYTAENRTELRVNWENKKKDFQDWLVENKINIDKIAPLKLEGVGKVYAKFEKMYDLIKTEYSRNYKSGSGDCKELINEVICE